MTRIVFVHLLNDYSGSPLVLSNLIRGLQKEGYACDVITNQNSEGFLSNLEGVNYRYFTYRWHPNRYMRLLLFLWSQVVVFFKIWAYRKEKVIVYTNTLLPFGANLAGRILGKKVVCHIHELSLRPLALKQFLRWMANKCADQSIYVSAFLMEKEQLPAVSGTIVHNALSDYFKRTADEYRVAHKSSDVFTVLMLCSLKAYKGVDEFVQVAKALPHIRFELVVNATREEIQQYFQPHDFPPNLTTFDRQSNVHPFYQRAHLVLNLSHPEQWVETFGMTLLEGMYYGLPCIAPPIGGPTEIVEDQKNGFLIDQREVPQIAETIRRLADNEQLYQRLANQATLTSSQFSYTRMLAQIQGILQTVAD